MSVILVMSAMYYRFDNEEKNIESSNISVLLLIADDAWISKLWSLTLKKDSLSCNLIKSLLSGSSISSHNFSKSDSFIDAFWKVRIVNFNRLGT